MNPLKSLHWKSAVAIALLVAAVPMDAQKRRAVQHPAPAGPTVEVTVTGTVLDAVTNAPVVFAEVRLGDKSARTDSRGKFSITNKIHGTAPLTVSRSGYVAGQESITGNRDVTLRLQPTPTIRLRMVNGQEYDIDFESAEFGYVPPFGSYVKSESEQFCRPGGTAETISRASIRRITGPAVSESHAPCCPNNPLLKINATLKSGETTPLYFAESCDGYRIDFIGRNHTTGSFVFAKFTEIAEIVFP